MPKRSANNAHFGVETVIPIARLLFLQTHESILELLEAIPGFQELQKQQPGGGFKNGNPTM
jgi:hypothetical protein